MERSMVQRPYRWIFFWQLLEWRRNTEKTGPKCQVKKGNMKITWSNKRTQKQPNTKHNKSDNHDWTQQGKGKNRNIKHGEDGKSTGKKHPMTNRINEHNKEKKTETWNMEQTTNQLENNRLRIRSNAGGRVTKKIRNWYTEKIGQEF